MHRSTQHCPGRRVWWGAALATLLLTGLGTAPAKAETLRHVRPTVSAPARADSVVERTRQVQFLLKSYGYTIVVDGLYGPQTTKVVKAWQRANGLRITGVVDAQTWHTLTIAGPASGGAPAQRLNPPAPATSLPPGPVTAEEVKQIIRDVWPDDLEERAIRIGYRESRYVPTVHTSCCFGVMQVHKQHLAWLCPQLGICTTHQLFDPVLNVQAAYALYERIDAANGDRDGWSPWAA